MKIKDQKKLPSSFGLALSLASAALPSLCGCQSIQENYIGTGVQTVPGVSRTVTYAEETIFPGLPPKGILTVESSDGALVRYHDDYGDGWVDRKEVFAPGKSQDEIGGRLVSSQRWIRLSRYNILSVAGDIILEYFPDREHQRTQLEYLDWLTWLGGEKRR